jgi:uncharacterized protein (TIGR04255 family)
VPDIDPLVAEIPAEVPLRDAPLVRVIAQVRFPLVIAIQQREFVAPFQEAIRKRYPVLRQEQTQGIVLAPPGVQVQLAPPSPVWRFADAAANWRVSLAPEFLAIETTKYSSRDDFLARFEHVARALAEHVDPQVVDRVGLRYIDRIAVNSASEIAPLVRSEVLGFIASKAASHLQHSLCESVFAVDQNRLLARWGILPPNTTYDAGALEPVAHGSWVLDLDLFRETPQPFATDDLVREAKAFAERIYAVFRWAVTTEFLRRHGGEL